MKESSADPLTRRVLAYRRTGLGGDELIGELSIIAYRYPRKAFGATEDEPGEFLLYFLPRLRRMLDRFEDNGVPFEHYLNSALAWNLRAYRRRARRQESTWRAARSRDFWDWGDRPAEAPRQAILEIAGRLGETDSDGVLLRETDRRRLLLILARSAWYVSDSDIEAGAKALGVSSEWLEDKLRCARLLVARKLDRLECLRHRRNWAFARLQCLRRMAHNAAMIDSRALSGGTADLERKVAQALAAWKRAIQDMSRVRLSPTHRELAVLLGIPRGTIDTSLRWVRLRQQELQEERRIKYA